MIWRRVVAWILVVIGAVLLTIMHELKQSFSGGNALMVFRFLYVMAVGLVVGGVALGVWRR